MKTFEQLAPEAENIEHPIHKVLKYLGDEHTKLNDEFEKMDNDSKGNEFRIGPDFRVLPPPASYREEHKMRLSKIRDTFANESETGIRKEEERLGNQLEILKTAVMHEYLGGDFFVLRTSHYDDVVNGVDNIIVHKPSGEVICALDEVEDTPNENSVGYGKKMDKFLEKNFDVNRENEKGFGGRSPVGSNPGGYLEYGPHLENGKIVPTTLSGLPTFILALDKRHLLKGVEEFRGDKDKHSHDHLLFSYFISSIYHQIQALKLDSHGYKNLPPDFQRRVSIFEKFLKGYGVVEIKE